MGVYEVKARKGLIRARVEVSGGRIVDARLTGDFFLYPEDALWGLEERLRGTSVNREAIRRVVEGFLEETGARLVGSTVDDFVEAIYCAATGGCGD